MGKKESAREEDVTVASLRSLDVNGITPAQMLPLIRILKVLSCIFHVGAVLTLHVVCCRQQRLSNCKWKRR